MKLLMLTLTTFVLCLSFAAATHGTPEHECKFLMSWYRSGYYGGASMPQCDEYAFLYRETRSSTVTAYCCMEIEGA